jgi:pyrroloquinoline quinone (PQQ) biosynthesis protein C
MRTITKSVIKLSEIPKHLQEIFNGYRIHTYAEFHIDDLEKDDLSLWLIETYPTIKMKISFLIHIDIETQQQSYSEEEVENILIEYVKTNPTKPYRVISWFREFKKK